MAAIGSGPASISLSKWSRSFADVAVQHFQTSERPDGSDGEEVPPLSIVLVLFESPSFEEDRALLERAVWHAWVKAGRPRTGRLTVRLGPWRKHELAARAEVARRAAAFARRFKSAGGYRGEVPDSLLGIEAPSSLASD